MAESERGEERFVDDEGTSHDDEVSEVVLDAVDEISPDGGDEGLESEGELVEEIEHRPPAKLSRRDKKRKKILEAAVKEYGADLVRTLEKMRDPKERIVFVAEAVFARNGFGGARTQQIADLAGVNKAMIHYYFESKEKLYHAVLDKILFDLIKLTQESVRDNASAAVQLEIFCKGFFDYIASHRNFSRLTAMARGTGDRYLARMVETFVKPLFNRGEGFIRRGIAEGVFHKKVVPRQFLVGVYGMTISYFSDAEFIAQLYGEDPLSDKLLKERREALLDMIFAGLGCDRPS